MEPTPDRRVRGKVKDVKEEKEERLKTAPAPGSIPAPGSTPALGSASAPERSN